MKAFFTYGARLINPQPHLIEELERGKDILQIGMTRDVFRTHQNILRELGYTPYERDREYWLELGPNDWPRGWVIFTDIYWRKFRPPRNR